MLESPSLAWQKLHDVYYALHTCYDDLNWPLEDLAANYSYCVSPNSTLIALASKSGPYPNVVDIYALTGAKLWSVVFNSLPHEHIVGFCFHGEHLVVVLSSRKYRVYTDFYGTFNEYDYAEGLSPLDSASSVASEDARYVITNLESNATEEPFHPLECLIWGPFLVLRHNTRVTFSNIDSLENYDLNLSRWLQPSLIHCVAMVSASASTAEFLIAYSDTVYVATVDFAARTADLHDQKLTTGPFSTIAVSANGSLFAMFSHRHSRIYVVTSDLDRVLLEYDTSNESTAPYMVQWCANDAIVLSLRDEIKLVGPHQNALSFFYDLVENDEFVSSTLTPRSRVSFIIPIITPNHDGLTIITPHKVEFLSRVPTSLVNLHYVGSTHPSAALLSCVDKLQAQLSKADTTISLLNADNALRPAMDACLDAALHEFSPLWQKKILKAVSFGKIYDDDIYNAENYLHVLNTLRVLDQLRSPEVGLFLTIDKINHITWDTVIQMLLTRRLHLLAISIISLLKLKNLANLVYVDWCCCKIRKELNMLDMDLFNIVARKLVSAESVPRKNSGFWKRNYIPVSDISDVALQEGRSDLCKLLIALEPSVLERVHQYLKIGDPELALLKAFQAGDTDLCEFLLRYLFDTLTKAQFFHILSQNELRSLLTFSKGLDKDVNIFFQENLFINGDLIGNFWSRSIAKNDRKLYESYLKREDKYSERAFSKLKAAVQGRQSEPEAFDYEDTYQRHRSKIQLLGKNPRYSAVVQQEIAVLDLKKRLSETYQQSFFRLESLSSVLEKLIEMHQLKPAAKICKDFKVPVDRFWNLIVEKYCKMEEFGRLKAAVLTPRQKSSLPDIPFSLVDVAEACIAYEAPQEVTSEIVQGANDATYTARADILVRIGDFDAAAKEALANKDKVLITKISQLCKDTQTASRIRAMVDQL